MFVKINFRYSKLFIICHYCDKYTIKWEMIPTYQNKRVTPIFTTRWRQYAPCLPLKYLTVSHIICVHVYRYHCISFASNLFNGVLYSCLYFGSCYCYQTTYQLHIQLSPRPSHPLICAPNVDLVMHICHDIHVLLINGSKTSNISF